MSGKTKTSSTSSTAAQNVKAPAKTVHSEEDKSIGEKRDSSQMDVNLSIDKKKGRLAFLSSLENEGVAPTRTLKSSNGGTPMVTVEAVVVSTNLISVKGKKEGSTVPKLEVTAFTRMVRANGAPDCVDSGIPGLAFLLPTMKHATSESGDGGGGNGGNGGNDAGPEAALANKGKSTSDKKTSSPPRTLCLTEAHKTIWIGFIRTSIYTTPPGGGDESKDKAKTDTDAIRPGAVVEIAGNVANLGSDGKTLWLNSSRVTPLRPDFDPIDQTSVLISEFLSPDSALVSAFLASQCANGFFGHDFGIDEARNEQAMAFHRMWVSLPEQLSKASEALASSLRSASSDDDSNVKILTEHAARLASTSPIDLASGTSLPFLPTMPPSQDKPFFCAPLVQIGKTPYLPQPSIIMDLVEQTNHTAIPKTFVALDAREVEFNGAAINLKCGLFFVGDKNAAIKKLDAGLNPILSTGKYASAGIRLNMRTFCGTIGSISKVKAEMAASALLKFGDIATVARLSPKPFNSDGLVCTFPDSFSIGMPVTIPRVSVEVSEKWVQTHLCGGATQFVFESDPETIKITEKDGRTAVNVPLPQLKLSGYQAISESGFKFANSKSPLNKPVKKYFVMTGSTVDFLAENGGVPIEEGEKFIESEASTASLPMDDFLLTLAIVYCVAASAPIPSSQ